VEHRDPAVRLDTLEARVQSLESQFLQLRTEMHEEFSAVRKEMRGLEKRLRHEMRGLDEQLRL